MPRKRKQKPEDIREIARAIGLTTAAELPPPELTPTPSTVENLHHPPHVPLDGQESGFVAMLRPAGPRKRGRDEPATSFAGRDITIDLQHGVWQVKSERELTGVEKDRLAASGFQAVDDDERTWNAGQRTLRERGADINLVAVELGKPLVSRGWAR